MLLVKLDVMHNNILPKCEELTTCFLSNSFPNLLLCSICLKRERTESSACTICRILKILIFIKIISYEDGPKQLNWRKQLDRTMSTLSGFRKVCVSSKVPKTCGGSSSSLTWYSHVQPSHLGHWGDSILIVHYRWCIVINILQYLWSESMLNFKVISIVGSSFICLCNC